MHFCSRCGCTFNLSDAKRVIGRRFGAGTYDDFYSDDVCEDCALEELSCAYNVGEDVLNDARSCGWDDDDD